MTDYAVLALDPGKTTGVCMAHLRSGTLRLSVDQAEMSLTGLFSLLSNWVDMYKPLSVVYESFEYRNNPRTGLDLTPVKMIGVIELFSEWHSPFVTFYSQTAATAKGYYKDARLKELGVYKVGKQHGRDATRHFLHWVTFGAGGQYIDIEKVRLQLA